MTTDRDNRRRQLTTDNKQQIETTDRDRRQRQQTETADNRKRDRETKIQRGRDRVRDMTEREGKRSESRTKSGASKMNYRLRGKRKLLEG